MSSGCNFLTPQVLFAVAALVGEWAAPIYDEPPPHTPVSSGSEYVEELLSCGDDERILDVFRMPLATFLALRDWCMEHGHLQPTRHMSVEEQLAIFLKIVGENASNRAAQKQFRRSGDTVSRAFKKVLDAMAALYSAVVKQPAAAAAAAASQPTPTTTPPRIRNDPEIFPYFKDCLGVAAAPADGSTHNHADVHVPDGRHEVRYRNRNRKGDLVGQNVVGMCIFDELFCHVLPDGWEGSVHDDDRELQAALGGGDLVVLPGSYYLINAGHGLRPGFLPPYRSVRYHHQPQQNPPQNKEELFNLRHAQLRSGVEPIFEILKRRFRILLAPAEYPHATRVKLVFALTALHNFIRKNNDASELDRWRGTGVEVEVHDGDGNSSREESIEIDAETDTGVEEESEAVQGNGGRHMAELRDQIAEDMWRDYTDVRRGDEADGQAV